MSLFFYWLLLFFTSAMAFLSLVLLIECLASLFPRDFRIDNDYFDQISVAVLIPAHNEETVIAETISSIIPQLKKQDRLIVIADNCCDRTATIAREMGVTVIERENKELRGKGYALDYGMQYLTENPPEILILVDADCIVEEGAIKKLTETAKILHQPVQALYLMETPPQPSPKDLISAFAVKVKNLVRLGGLYNLKQPCLLAGTGMAFPWDVIQTVNLASSHIVEDMKLGLDLAIAKYPPVFCPSTQIIGKLPTKIDTATTQRKRWEHGHLEMIISYVPRLIIESIKQKRLDLLVIALDLSIPPLSLFVALCLAVTFMSALFMILGGSYLPFFLSAIALLQTMMGILVAWAKYGRKDLPLITLMKVPLYILWKIPLYLQFLFNREKQWIRTERDNLER